VCNAAQKWHPAVKANGKKNRRSRKPRSLLALKATARHAAQARVRIYGVASDLV
jgi:hypothetical protein